MTVDEARELLAPYAEGSLEPAKALELEALLAQKPELQAEYQYIKEENALLCEALRPMLPSQSTRTRVTDAMVKAYEEAARNADKALVEKTQRINRSLLLIIVLGILGIAVIAVLCVWLVRNRPPKRLPPPNPPQCVSRQL